MSSHLRTKQNPKYKPGSLANKLLPDAFFSVRFRPRQANTNFKILDWTNLERLVLSESTMEVGLYGDDQEQACEQVRLPRSV